MTTLEHMFVRAVSAAWKRGPKLVIARDSSSRYCMQKFLSKSEDSFYMPPIFKMAANMVVPLKKKIADRALFVEKILHTKNSVKIRAFFRISLFKMAATSMAILKKKVCDHT